MKEKKMKAVTLRLSTEDYQYLEAVATEATANVRKPVTVTDVVRGLIYAAYNLKPSRAGARAYGEAVGTVTIYGRPKK